MTLFKRGHRPNFLDDKNAAAITAEQALQATKNLTFEGLQVVASFGFIAANKLARVRPSEMERFFSPEAPFAESY
jgi:hypothetical protein